MAHLIAGHHGVLYMQDKLGGEVSISATPRSPELAFDVTLVSVSVESGRPRIGKYGILEIQTMDFHGSYRHAVANLQDVLRLHAAGFADQVEANPQWLADRIEGPNIANVFKRTFYQTLLKFRIATHSTCAGCVLALPQSVWDSWQRHLGKPELLLRADGTKQLLHSSPGAEPNAWITVFDIDASASMSPNRIRVVHEIATDSDTLAHYALRVAPDAAIAEGGSMDRVIDSISSRLASWWPELVTE